MLPAIRLVTAHGARAEVFSYGAQVTSWMPADGVERLFLSPRSLFRAGASIRGGIPVVFPQFSNQGPLPKHGFVRTTTWDVVDVGAADGGMRALFRTSSSSATEALWPHAFVAEVDVRLTDDSLSVELAVTNPGAAPIEFTCALHTYLRVDDVHTVVVRGLGGLRYLDAAGGRVERRQDADDVTIAGEVDRIYYDAKRPVEVVEPARTTRVTMRGFTDVVVWNPGATLTASLADMEPDGYLRMLCVEAAAVGTPVVLPPGERWSGAQVLEAIRAQ